MQEWISLNQFMKRYKVGYDVALKMIYNKKVDCIKTNGGRYKIKVTTNDETTKDIEKLIRENEEFKTIIKSLKLIIDNIEI